MKKFKFIIEKSAPASFVVEAENIIQAEEIMRDKMDQVDWSDSEFSKEIVRVITENSVLIWRR